MDKERLQYYKQQLISAHQQSFTKEKAIAYALLQESTKEKDPWAEAFAYCSLYSCCICLEQQVEVQYYKELAFTRSEQHQFPDLLALCYFLQGRYFHRTYDDTQALDCYCKGLSLIRDDQHKELEGYLRYEIACVFYSHDAFEDACVYATNAYHLSQQLSTQSTTLPEEVLYLLVLIELRMGSFSQASLHLSQLQQRIGTATFLFTYCQVVLSYQQQHVDELPSTIRCLLSYRHQACLERFIRFSIYDHVLTITIAIQQQTLAKQCLMMLCESSHSHFPQQQLIVQRHFINLCEAFPCCYDKQMLYQDYFHLNERAVQQQKASQVQTYQDKLNTFALQQQNLILQQQANIDQVTKLKNRNSYQQEIKALLTKPHLHTIGVAMCDIDNFKEFNDVYGHLYGDKIIRLMADILRTYGDDTIIPYRFGGDEFLCLFLNKTEQEVCAYLQQVFTNLKQQQENLHISAGYSICELQALSTLDELIQEADRALYWAKDCGKNQFKAYQK